MRIHAWHGALALGVFGILFGTIAAAVNWSGEASAIHPGFAPLAVSGCLLAVLLLVKRAVGEAARSADEEALAAKSLRGQLERQKKAIDALGEGLNTSFFICDARAEILYANPGSQETFRFENPVGRSILAVTLSYELEQLVLEAGRSESAVETELSFNYPAERTALARAWREPEGDRVFVSLYDISELRRLERVRQDFVANVSHELRTPLAAIRVIAETLHDEPDTALDKRNEYLTRVMAEVDRLASIVADLLVLSSAEAGTPALEECDLGDLARKCLELLCPKAAERGLELTFEGPDSLVVQANPSQIHQVMINLVDNAINYTPKGSVAVRLGLEAKEAVFEVRDTGLGIASEHLPRVFERFYRVDKGRSRASGGTGLGLSIVKHIVEAHGGTVHVESDLNKGSIFTVRLPAWKPQ